MKEKLFCLCIMKELELFLVKGREKIGERFVFVFLFCFFVFVFLFLFFCFCFCFLFFSFLFFSFLFFSFLFFSFLFFSFLFFSFLFFSFFFLNHPSFHSSFSLFFYPDVSSMSAVNDFFRHVFLC